MANSNSMDKKEFFSDLDISSTLKQGINDLGYVSPTAFQKEIFSHFQSGKNIVGQGNSTYGKSLAFSLPILAKIKPDLLAIQALIITESLIQADLVSKEIKAIGQHANILVHNASKPSLATEEIPQICIVSANDLAMHVDRLDKNLHTIFFDGLSLNNAQKTLEILNPFLKKSVQLLIFGDETLKTFNEHPHLKNASFISNTDQAKPVTLTKHIVHEQMEGEVKTRALLAILELHQLKNALITCNEATTCEMLAKFLARYDFDAKPIHQDLNSHSLRSHLESLAEHSFQIIICQNSLLRDVSLANIPCLINYDMHERPKDYEELTQFTKQAPGINRTVINLVATNEMGYLGPIKAQCQIELTEQAIPTGDEVVALSAKRLLKNLSAEASNVELGQYEALASYILGSEQGALVLALLMRNHYLSKNNKANNNESEHSSRPHFKQRRPERRSHHEDGPRIAPPPEGTTRLYITLGRQDGIMDLASLAQYLSGQSKVDLGHFCGGGMLRDHSAHIEVDSEVAENIITHMNGSPRPGSKDAEHDSAEANTIICELAKQSVSRFSRRPSPRRRY